MKKYIHLSSIVIMLVSATLFLSCEKSGTSNGSAGGGGGTVSQSGTVKKTEDPKSSLRKGTFELDLPAAFQNKSTTANSVSVSNASKSNVSASAKDRHDIFVSKDNNRATGYYIWTIIQMDTMMIDNNEIWAEFGEDGTYIVYDFSDDDWWWGYYYIDEYMEYLIFDAGTEYEEWWKINYIETVDEETGEVNIHCMDDEGTSFVLGSFLVEDWEETAYTASEYNDFLVGKTWVNDFTYVEDLDGNSNTNLATNEEYNLIALDFRADNVVLVYSVEVNYGEVNTPTAAIDTASYSVSADGVLTYTDEDGSVDLRINYTGDYTGDGVDDYFRMSFQDEDYYFEMEFVEQSVFETEYYSIGYYPNNTK